MFMIMFKRIDHASEEAYLKNIKQATNFLSFINIDATST